MKRGDVKGTTLMALNQMLVDAGLSARRNAEYHEMNGSSDDVKLVARKIYEHQLSDIRQAIVWVEKI